MALEAKGLVSPVALLALVAPHGHRRWQLWSCHSRVRSTMPNVYRRVEHWCLPHLPMSVVLGRIETKTAREARQNKQQRRLLAPARRRSMALDVPRAVGLNPRRTRTSQQADHNPKEARIPTSPVCHDSRRGGDNKANCLWTAGQPPRPRRLPTTAAAQSDRESQWAPPKAVLQRP